MLRDVLLPDGTISSVLFPTGFNVRPGGIIPIEGVPHRIYAIGTFDGLIKLELYKEEL